MADEIRVTPFISFAVAAVVCAALVSTVGDLPHLIAPLSILTGISCLFWSARICLHLTRLALTAIAGASVIFAIVTLDQMRSPRAPDRLQLDSQTPASMVLRAEVDEVVGRSPFGWRLRADVETVDGEGVPRPVCVLLFIPVEWAERDNVSPGAVIDVFAEVEPFSPGDFPHGFDERDFYTGRGYRGRATAREPPEMVTQRSHWRRELTLGRLWLEDRVLASIDQTRAGPILALTTGTRGFLAPEYRAPFVQTGTAHLLAISGLHLGAMAALLWFAVGSLVVRLAPRACERHGRRRLCGVVVVGALGAYVAAIGAPVSAVRALCAVAVAVGAICVFRAFCPLHTLAAAALGAVLIQPSVVHELGFQLSFSATLGILLFLESRPIWLEPGDRPWDEVDPRRKWAARAALFIGVSVSASLGSWPVLLAHFGVVSGNGIWVNLVATPLFGTIIFPCVVGLTACACLSPAIAPVLLNIAHRLLDTTRAGLGLIAELPGSEVIVGVPSGWAIGAAAVCVVAVCTSRARALRLFGALACLLLVLVVGSPDRPDDAVRVHFIPVGQGDATLLQFPGGANMLIDAGGRRMGPDPGRRLVVPYLHRLGVRRLDWLVVTHSDWDHLGGATAVVDTYGPDALVIDATDDAPALSSLTRRAERTGAELVPVSDLLVPDALPGVEIVRPDPVGRAARNDRSLVVLLRREQASALFAADIELIGENWLRRHRRTRSTLLKIPHHGSRTSSSRRFLDAVQPAVAVSSSGRDHHFGHPHQEVVDRYRRRGVAVFGTHRNGLVVVDLAYDGRVEVRALRRWIR